LLTAQPDMPGGLFTSKSMLEFDTTEKNIFITERPTESFSILEQVKENNGFASVSNNPGIGITPSFDFIKEFEVNE
jgi:D-galactarolactone cycloisomerase